MPRAPLRAVNDVTGTNVAQIVISGTARHTPPDILSMPAFGAIYSNVEIAAVANYVTGRFGSEGSRITENDVAHIARALSAGANEYIMKPFDKEIVEAKFQEVGLI